MWKYLNIWECLFPPPPSFSTYIPLLFLPFLPLCVYVCGKIAAIHILATYILLVLPGFSASILRD